MPVAPSQRVATAISEELEYAVLSCLEKARSKRPQTARDLANLLRKCPEYGQWTPEDADAWWYRHEHGESLEASRTSEAEAATVTSSDAPSDDTSLDPPSAPRDSTAGSFDATMAPREQPSQKRKSASRKKSPKRRPPKKD